MLAVAAAALRPAVALATFADDHYELRIRYAHVTGDRPGGIELLHRPRRRIEEALARVLAGSHPGPQ